MMKLTFVPNPDCYHMGELIKSIFAVSQLKQEFHPYLLIEHQPNRDNKPSRVIITTRSKTQSNNVLNIPVDFEKIPTDINKVRTIIWKLIHNNDMIKSNYNDFPTAFKNSSNVVSQGWENLKNNKKQQNNFPIVRQRKTPQPNRKLVLHDAYNVITTPSINKSNCNDVLAKQCNDNYPKSTYNYRKCMEEINDVCGCILNPKSTPKPKTPQKASNTITRRELNDAVFDAMYGRHNNKIEGFSNNPSGNYLFLISLTIVVLFIASLQ